MTRSPRGEVLEFWRDNALETTRVVPEQLPDAGPGSVLFRIERFGLTSNNVTYARAGDTLGYWASFPASESGWGRVPAWGAARVIAGDPDLVRPGELFVGFLPMATHALVRVEPLPTGLRATAPERAAMHPLYRDMARVDPVMGDVELAVLPGVPAAAHLVDEARAAEPAQVVFSSATSRTALTAAVLLRAAGVPTVGLTAAARVEVARRAEVYDHVVSYADLDDLHAAPGSVYVDIAGRPEITSTVHDRLGTALARSLRVGATHFPDPTSVPTPLPGPAVERFNVGQRRVEVAERLGEQGVAAFEHEARAPIVAWASEHFAIQRVHGLEQARTAWRQTWRGELDPLTAMMIVAGPQPVEAVAS